MAKWFSLVMPVVVLFFQDNGLSMTEIFWLKSVYSIGIVALEIPSGYFGDIWGRRKTLLIGAILTTLGFAFYGFSFSFWQFMVAELVLGMGQSCISGADSAMLYDSLKASKREDEYIKYEGRVTSIGNFSEAIAGVIGGFLALISLRTPFIIQSILASTAIYAAFTLKEPNIDRSNRAASMRDIWRIVKYALYKHKTLRQILLLSAVIGSATLTYAWFVQPYFLEVNVPLSLYGILWTALNLTVGAASFYSHKVCARMGKKKTLLFIVISTTIGFIVTGLFISTWTIFILFIFYVVRGIASPTLKDYIHGLIESDVRATILSLRDMLIRIFFAITGPFLGWLTDHFSLSAAYMLSGVLFGISGLAAAVPLLRRAKP